MPLPAKPPRLVQLRLAQHHDASDWQFFVFADLRRSADRPAVCCPHFAIVFKQCLITVYGAASRYCSQRPACVVLPVPDGAEKSMAFPDTPGMHSAESGMAAPTGGVPVQEETEIQPHILQLHPDTISRQTPVHAFVPSHDTVHRDALLLSHRSGGSPALPVTKHLQIDPVYK